MRPRQPAGRSLRLSAAGILTVIAWWCAACGDPSASPADTMGPVDSVHDTSDVWLQLGDYVLGAHPDMFVIGPEIVVYGDGSVFARVSGPRTNGMVSYTMATGRLSTEAMRQLADEVGALPSPTPLTDVPADAIAAPLTFDGLTWDVPTWQPFDASADPIVAFVESLRKTVRAASTTPWVPERWIIRRYGQEQCTGSVEPVEPLDYYEAAVYPHMLDRYPLGPFDCYG